MTSAGSIGDLFAPRSASRPARSISRSLWAGNDVGAGSGTGSSGAVIALVAAMACCALLATRSIPRGPVRRPQSTKK
jgi:hypothetical protein